MIKKRHKDFTKDEHTLYVVWAGFKARCYDQKHSGYHNYGGRGIKVCEEWIENAWAFICWALANNWQRGLQLDRKDNDGPYAPWNCRFVCREVQCSNTRRSYRIDINGENLSLKEAVDKFSTAPLGMVRRRLREGWEPILALTFPPNSKRLDRPISKSSSRLEIFGESLLLKDAVAKYSTAPKGTVECRINVGWHPLNAVILPSLGPKIVNSLVKGGWNPTLDPLEALKNERK